MCVCVVKSHKRNFDAFPLVVTVFLSLFSFDLGRPLVLFFFSIEFPFDRLFLVYFILFVRVCVYVLFPLYFLCHFVQLLDCMMRHKFDWLFFNNVNKMFYHWCVCVDNDISLSKIFGGSQPTAHIKKRRKAERKRIWEKKKVWIEMKKIRHFTKENRQHW